MAMSLDMIGKFVLVTIMISVIVGLIMHFQSGITDNVASMLGGDDSKQGSKVVEISPGSGQKIASLIDTCYSRSLENSFKSYLCSVARAKSGSFSLSSGTLKGMLSKEVRESTDFEKTSYTGSSIIVRYNSKKGKVVVK